METATDAYVRVTRALEAHGSRTRDQRTWTCPAHDDRDPSLSVSRGEKGAVLRCHAGCETSEIVKTLGLEMHDLFDSNGSTNGRREIIATYDYGDEENQVLSQVVRFSPKTFRQRRPDGNGGWSWKLGRVRRVPYRLRELLDAVAAGDPVFVCEGEKDADRVRSANFPATCNPGGAGKWRDEYSEHFRNAPDVRVIADKDEPGYKHAANVTASLRSVGARVTIYEPAHGKDVSDHLAAGASLEELIVIDPEEKIARETIPTTPPFEKPVIRGIDVTKPVMRDVDNVDIATFDTTDLANAQRLVSQFRNDLRWCPGVGFLVWTDTHWEASDMGAQKLASQLGRLIHMEAAELVRTAGQVADQTKREEMGKQAQALIAWGRTSESESKIKAALNLTRPYVEVSVDHLDADPWTLNVLNGTIDLETGRLRPHRRDDLLTKLAPVRYDPDAKSELWEKFLERAIPDTDARWFFQKAAGYSLAGVTGEDVLLVVHGPPRTGKGTSQDAIAATLGPYAITLGLEDLAHREHGDGSRPRPELTRLRGARMASIYETSSSMRLSAALVKTLCGSDPITARAMYKEPITFLPQFTLWLATNHRPKAPNDDEALWERIRELPFPTVIPPEERDPQVRVVLRDPDVSGAAILAWAVEGCLAWQSEGLAPPEVVRHATQDYRQEMDPLRDFLETYCILGDGHWATASDLRSAYEQFARETGDHPVGRRRWATGLRSHGCVDDRAGGRRIWRGVGLITQETAR